MSNKTQTAKFTAHIDWGTSTDNTDDFDKLPPEFSKAKTAFDAGNMKEACDLLTPFISCQFIASNLYGDINSLLGIDEDDEINATSVRIDQLDFSTGSIPSIKATAVFEFITENCIDETGVEAWEEENESLDNALSFSWAIDDLDDELDQSISEHEGLGFSLATR